MPNPNDEQLISTVEAAALLGRSRPGMIALAALHGLRIQHAAGRHLLNRGEVLALRDKLAGERTPAPAA